MNIGAHIGALPWLAVYSVGWGVKGIGQVVVWSAVKTGQGIVTVGRGIGNVTKAVFKKPDPAPVIQDYEQISGIYTQLAAEAAQNCAKREKRVQLARDARDTFVINFISEQPDLMKLAASEGWPAARKKAARRLDIYAQAYQKHLQADKWGQSVTDEFRQFSNDEMKKLESQFEGLALGHIENEATDVLSQRNQAILKGTKRLVGWITTAARLRKLHTKWKEAKADGKTFKEWFHNKKVAEEFKRIGLNALGPMGQAAEKILDSAYSTTVQFINARETMKFQENSRRLWAMSSMKDFHARGWLAQKARLAAEEKMAAKSREQKQRYLNKSSNYKRKINDLQK